MACPREGDPAPDFEFESKSGRTSISSMRGSPIVIYFFPKAFTQGCTRELQRFVQLAGEFEALGAEVIGVSADGPGTTARFAAKYGARFPLVPDAEKRIISEYCAGSERGKGARRVTFVVGPDGMIKAVLEGLRKAEDHADGALDVLRSSAHRA